LFLSHSSRDKTFARRLADDLVFCQVDVWLDEWELQVGDSLHDGIGNALEKSRFIGLVLGDNFSDSVWARDELKQALSREKRAGRTLVLPLIFGNCQIPPFLEDKIFLDFRSDYYGALARLAGTVHEISRQRMEEAVRVEHPHTIGEVIDTLRYVGIEPYVILDEDDFREIVVAGGVERINDRVRFDPQSLLNNKRVSMRIRNLMTRLINEVWKETKRSSQSVIEVRASTSQRVMEVRPSIRESAMPESTEADD